MDELHTNASFLFSAFPRNQLHGNLILAFALQTWESINYHPSVLPCDTFLPSMTLDHLLSTFFISFPNIVLSLLFEEKI